jgi:TP901 family phage tail tape measure protein
MAFNAGAVVGKVLLDDSQYKKASKDVVKSSKMMGVGIAAAGAVMVAALASSIKTTNEFVKAFANVRTLVDETAVDMGTMQNELLALDSRLGSAKNLTEGLYQALSASVDPAKAVKFVGEAAKFAQAALTDTNTAVDAITTALNAYRFEADKAADVSDIFFQIVKRGKTTGDQLAKSIGNVIPTAATLNVSLEELGASLATMTKQGINTNVATTQLTQLMQAFIKPSEEMTAAIQEFGFESGSALIKTEGLEGALKFLEEATGGNIEEMAKLIPNVRGLKGALALTGNAAKIFEQDLVAMNNASGAVNEAFGKQELTFETLKNQTEKLQIAIGTLLLPTLFDITNVATEFLTTLTELTSTENKIVKESRELETTTGTLVDLYKEYRSVSEKLKDAKDDLSDSETRELTTRKALLRLDITNQLIKLKKSYEGLFDSQGKLLFKFQEQEQILEGARELFTKYSTAILDAQDKNEKFVDIAGHGVKVSMDIAVSALQDVTKTISELENGFEKAETQISDSILTMAQAIQEGIIPMEALAILPIQLREQITEAMTETTKTIETGSDANLKIIEDTNKKIKKNTEKTFDEMQEIIIDNSTAIGESMKNAGDKIDRTFFERIKDRQNAMKDRWKENGGAILSTVQNITSQIAGMYKMVFDSVMMGLNQQLEATRATHQAERDDLAVQKENELIALEEERAAGLISEEEFKQKQFEVEKKYTGKEDELHKKQIDKENAQEKKIFDANKANRIAETWIQFAIGTMGVWSQSLAQLGPIAGSIMAGILTTFLLGTAIAQTVMISQQQFVPKKRTGGFASGANIINEDDKGELVILPDRSIVVPHDLSRQIASGVGRGRGDTMFNINFRGANITNDMSLRKVSRVVSRDISKRLRSKR